MMMQEFKVGDIISFAVNADYAESLFYVIKDDYRCLDWGENYTVLRDCSCDDEILMAFEIRILSNDKHLETPQIISLKEHPDKIFIAERFYLDKNATKIANRKAKIEDILS
jgi:hypothetical protein